LRDKGYYEEAEKYYKELVEVSNSFEPYYGYGELLLKCERYPEARNMFREVLGKHKGHAMAHLGLAKSLYKLGEYKEAEKEFRSTIYWWKGNDDERMLIIAEIENVANAMQKLIESSDLAKVEIIKSADGSVQKINAILGQTA